MQWRPILAALTVMLFDCASLEPLPEGTCGNRVVDENEDCDGLAFSNGTTPTSKTQCGGLEDGARACRLKCDRANPAQPDSACPPGWGCGVDGICRQASGAFSKASERLSGGAFVLSKGDFDGDGRVDLIGAPPFGSGGGVRVHYFDENARLADVRAIDEALGSLVVFDVDRDGIDDITFAYPAALGSLKGERDRTFSALLSPALTFKDALVRAAPVDAPAGVVFDRSASCALALVDDIAAPPERSPRFRSICESDFLGLPSPRFYLPYGVSPTEIAQSLSSGKFLRDDGAAGSSACGEVVGGRNRVVDGRKAGQLFVVSPCVRDGKGRPEWSSTAATDGEAITKLPLLELDVPGEIDSQPFMADVDSDGIDEILVHSSNFVVPKIPFTSGYWAFASAGGSLPAIFFIPIGAALPTKPDEERILTIADFDKNGVPDTVTTKRVRMNDARVLFAVGPRGGGVGDAGVDGGDAGVDEDPVPGGGPEVAGEPRTGRWAEAHVGHFNADDRADILLRSEDAFDAELLLNAGNGQFTPYVIRSDKPVRSVLGRDLDGDRIDDVVFLQSNSDLRADDKAEKQLVIAYGRAAGAPDAPHVAGTFRRARTLFPLGGGTAGSSRVVVIETELAQARSETVATVILGNPGRQTYAPLFFNDELSERPPLVAADGARLPRLWRPIAVAAGSLISPAPQTDLLAIATVAPPRDTQTVSATLPTNVWAATFDPARSAFTALEGVQPLDSIVAGLDGRKLAERGLVSIGAVMRVADIDPNADRIPKADRRDEVVAVVRSPGGETGLLVVDPRTAAEAPPKLEFTIADAEVAADVPLELVDVDGDGARDVVTILRVGGRKTLMVFPNDGNRRFSSTPIKLTLPENEEPVAFTPMSIGLRTALAVVTRTKLFVLYLDPTRAGFESPTSIAIGGTGVLSGIAAGDFDGDGVEDIALADSGSIRIVRQGPKKR